MDSQNTNGLHPAVVIGCHVMGLAVIRGLGVMGVPVVAMTYDEGDMAHQSIYVTRTIPSPHPEKSENQFIELLLQNSDELKGSLLIPTTDEAVAAVSRNKQRLDPYYLVACTEWSITEKFVNKKYTYELAKSFGVPTPITTVPDSENEVRRYCEKALFPLLVKPCQGHKYFDRFRRKMILVKNLDETLLAYNKAIDAGLEIMLQEWIPGVDSTGVNYNSYFWNGKPQVEFTSQKIRNAPPQLGSPRVAISKVVQDVLEPGRKLLQAMEFYGYSCTEFKRDQRDGIYKLMEVNGRHNRSGMLALKCGINFPWLQYKHLVLGEIPSPEDFMVGIYWIDFFRDLSYSLSSFRAENYSLGEYLKPYFSPHVDSIWDKDDPKPFFIRGINLIKRVF